MLNMGSQTEQLELYFRGKDKPFSLILIVLVKLLIKVNSKGSLYYVQVVGKVLIQ